VTGAGATRRWLAICAGAIGGTALWAVNMQLGQILPYVECGSRFYPVLLVSFAAAAVSLICGWVSWRSSRVSVGRTEAATGTRRFAAQVSALLGLVFAFVLLLHAASALLLTGCER
jgi:hypothetical protein